MDLRINVLLALMLIGSFLLAIVLHEFGHALMASWLGDPTPRAEGRQTLGLSSHIDLVGILLCIILAFQPASAIPIGLGWGKPVKPDPWKMRTGANSGVLIVALAGPLFNLLIGLLVAGVLHFVTNAFMLSNPYTLRVLQLLTVFASVNIGIAIFNIIPLYPLDGYQVLYTLLPSKQAVQYARWAAPYGPFIILAFFFFVPFLARLSGVDNFPLFRLAYYIWLASVNLIALVAGVGADSLNVISAFYSL